MARRGTNRLWVERSRQHIPPPNPLLDPIGPIKRRPKALNERRRGQGAAQRRRPVIEFEPMDVKHIRARFAATQTQFARLIGISYETLRNWETGKRRPQGPARALLRAIDADPFALARALNWSARDFRVVPLDMLDC
jgi:putative transcriptional regulator